MKKYKKSLIALSILVVIGMVLFFYTRSYEQSLTSQSQPVNFTTVGQVPYVMNLTGSGTAFYQLVWNVSGTLSGCTIRVDSSSNGVSFNNGDVIPNQSCTSNGTITTSSALVANFVRINPNATIIGTGTLTAILTGYATLPGAGGLTSVTTQILGQITIGFSAGVLTSTPAKLFVSGFCQSIPANNYSTCPGSTDESTGIVAAYNQCGGSGGSGGCYVVDDLTGTQTWSVQPFTANKATGVFEVSYNGANTHIIMLDGIDTVRIPNMLRIIGMNPSENGFAAANQVWQAANPLIHNVLHGGFQIQHGAIASTSVVGAVMTVTMAAAPFNPSTGNNFNRIGQYREICIGPDSGTPTNIGCWVVQSVTSNTSPQVFTVGVISGTTSSCASGCGTGYLDTPLFGIGLDSNASGRVFAATIENFSIDCSFMIGAGGAVNGQGNEKSGIGRGQIYNCPTYGVRIDESNAYDACQPGVGTCSIVGDTNSGPYGPWGVNFNPDAVTLTGGANCTGGGACSAGKVPVGSQINGCGDGTTQGIITPYPCTNGNYAGVLVTGSGGNQGPGRFQGHITTSIQDKSHPAVGIASLQGSAGATATGIMVIGTQAQFDQVHNEFYLTAEPNIEVCGNTALNATWSEAYIGIQTSGVSFEGYFGGLIDIGTAGAGMANCQGIRFSDMNISGGGVGLSDNINGNTCSDGVVNYWMGNVNNPVLQNSCTTGPGPQISQITIGAVGSSQTATITFKGTTSGTGTITCNPAATCGNLTTGKTFQFTSATGIALTGHLNQTATTDFAGSCTQPGTTGNCTWTLAAAFTSTPFCIPFKVSGIVTGVLSSTVSGTTVTINDTVVADTGVVASFCVGNPN